MARNEEEEARVTPPYIPLQTLTGFIDQLKSTALPPRIDNSVMHGKSGATQTGLRSAMRFLGLIHSNGTITDQLRRLAQAYGTEEWQGAFGDAILEAYRPYTPEIDLDSGTAVQLREMFRNNLAVEGQMLDKAVRFYLSAFDEAGMTYSPYFRRGGTYSSAARTRSGAAKRRRRANGKPKEAMEPKENEETPADQPPPAGMTRFPVPIPGKQGAVVTIPDDTTEEEWMMINTYIGTYIALRAKKNSAATK